MPVARALPLRRPRTARALPVRSALQPARREAIRLRLGRREDADPPGRDVDLLSRREREGLALAEVELHLDARTVPFRRELDADRGAERDEPLDARREAPRYRRAVHLELVGPDVDVGALARGRARRREDEIVHVRPLAVDVPAEHVHRAEEIG